MIELAGILILAFCWLSFLSPFPAAGDAHLPIVFSISLSLIATSLARCHLRFPLSGTSQST